MRKGGRPDLLARKLAPAASVSGNSQGLEEATTGVPSEPGKTTQQPYLVPKVLQAHLQMSLTKPNSVSASPQIQSVPKKGLSLCRRLLVIQTQWNHLNVIQIKEIKTI